MSVTDDRDDRSFRQAGKVGKFLNEVFGQGEFCLCWDLVYSDNLFLRPSRKGATFKFKRASLI